MAASKWEYVEGRGFVRNPAAPDLPHTPSVRRPRQPVPVCKECGSVKHTETFHIEARAARLTSTLQCLAASPEAQNAIAQVVKAAQHKTRAQNHVRRARVAGGGGSYTEADVEALLKRQKGKCAHPWCRTAIVDSYHIDHIVALSSGGSNWPRNLQLLCPFCNRSKHNKDQTEVARRNGFLC
jgi:hypothetical protein